MKHMSFKPGVKGRGEGVIDGENEDGNCDDVMRTG